MNCKVCKSKTDSTYCSARCHRYATDEIIKDSYKYKVDYDHWLDQIDSKIIELHVQISELSRLRDRVQDKWKTTQA